jgi:pheromone a factor receptor
LPKEYIVQGHRFDIFQEIGCYPAIYNTLPAYFISFMWPILIGLVSMVYCSTSPSFSSIGAKLTPSFLLALALRAFNRRRIQFNQFLASGTSLTMSRYFRLMALAMTAMLCTTPVACLVVYLNATATEIGPWRGWADTHFMYSRVEQIPSLIWRSSHQTVIAFELTRWAGPFCAVVFFAYFGFAQEARKHYRLALGAVGGAFWRGVGALGVRRPAAGFFAATSSSASQSQGKFALGAGVGYAKQHPSPHSPNSKHNAIDISLPAYSPGGTGSFTAGSFDADLKRAESFASTRSACTASASSSRFVERFIVRDPALDDVSVSSVYSADGHIDAHSPSSSHYHPETHPSRSHYHPDETHTPTSATSFHPSFVSSSTQETQTPTTPGSAFAYALPLHLGWAERAYPASPAPHAQGHAHRHGEEGQRGGEDSIRMEALRQQRQRHSV